MIDENLEFSEDWKKELDHRQEAYKSGKSTLISPEESKQRIKELLKR